MSLARIAAPRLPRRPETAQLLLPRVAASALDSGFQIGDLNRGQRSEIQRPRDRGWVEFGRSHPRSAHPTPCPSGTGTRTSEEPSKVVHQAPRGFMPAAVVVELEIHRVGDQGDILRSPGFGVGSEQDRYSNGGAPR